MYKAYRANLRQNPAKVTSGTPLERIGKLDNFKYNGNFVIILDCSYFLERDSVII